jgi:hypothetical protein
MPKPSTPALLEIQVRLSIPLRTKAAIQFSGIPHNPKPPSINVAPDGISCIASSAFATTLFIDVDLTVKLTVFRIGRELPQCEVLDKNQHYTFNNTQHLH